MKERWIRDLTQQRMKRCEFKCVKELVPMSEEYVKHHNETPKGFQWTKKASDILAKVKRAKAALAIIASAWGTALGFCRICDEGGDGGFSHRGSFKWMYAYSFNLSGVVALFKQCCMGES